MHEKSRWFWLLLLGLILLAAVPRLLIYDFSLPYIDHPDEGTSYLEALHWRGQYELGGGHPGYPPGHISLNWLVQSVVEGQLGGNITTTTHVMRLLSVTFNLLTLVVIACFGRLIAGDAAGLIAGGLWAFSPMVITNGIIAIPDPLLYLLVALSLALAGYAMTDPSRRVWGMWSFAVGLLAVLVKYQAFPVLVAGGFVALATVREKPSRGAAYLAVQAVSATVVAVVLVRGYGALRAFGTNRETVEMSESGFANVLDIGRVFINVYRVFTPIHAPLAVILVLVAMGAYAVARRSQRPTVLPAPLAVTVPVLLLLPWVASSFALVGADGSLIRHVMPVTTLACVLVGAALVQIAAALPTRTARFAPVAFGLLLVFWFGTDVTALANIVPQYRLPDTRVTLRQWADVSLEAGTVVVDEANHKTFNPYWGGVQGQQWFDWWESDDFMEYSVPEWRDERGMSYMAIPQDKWQQMQQTDAGQAYLAQMLPVRNFLPPPATRGPHVRFYRLWQMQHETDVRFGEHIRLVGYDAPQSRTFAPGDDLTLRFYWQADATPSTNYSLYIHLTPPDSRDVLAQVDGAPAMPQRPTVTWEHPDETLIGSSFAVSLPADLQPGEYRIVIGLYNFQTFERLPVDSGTLEDGYEIFRLEVD